MIKITTNKYGEKIFKASVTIEVECRIPKEDNRTEIPNEEAVKIVQDELYLIAGGSEAFDILANIPNEDIKLL